MNIGAIIWLTMALVLTTATQLRAPGMPIGPGELLLATWVLWALFESLGIRRGREELSRSAWIMLAFWTSAAGFLAAGTIAKLLVGIDDLGSSSHDSLALAFVAVTTVTVALHTRTDRDAMYTARCLAISSALASGTLLAIAITRNSLGPIDFWYVGIRFQGWSVNPNQFALLAVASPFVCLHFAAKSSARGQRVFLFVCAAILVVCGALTASDALAVSWIGSAALLIILATRDLLARPLKSVAVGVSFGLLIPAALISLAVFYGPSLTAALSDFVLGVYDVGGQGSQRLAIWQHAAIAYLRSPIVGLGPGSFSGYTAPFEGLEAHNSILDWAASTGVLGVGALLIVIGVITRRVLRSRSYMLLLALASLVAFSMFHFVLRHPLFWAWLLLLYQCASINTHTKAEEGSGESG